MTELENSVTDDLEAAHTLINANGKVEDVLGLIELALKKLQHIRCETVAQVEKL